MNRYICILRGINVGGHRKILMKDLIDLLNENGFSNIKTYIQSGNISFDTKLRSEEEIENKIKDLLLNKYEFEVPVIAITKMQIENIITNLPFDENKITHIIFLKETPSKEILKQFISEQILPDQFIINNKVIYLKCVDKYHKTKFSNHFFEKKLKVSATTRNWKTVNKLLELAEA